MFINCVLLWHSKPLATKCSLLCSSTADHPSFCGITCIKSLIAQSLSATDIFSSVCYVWPCLELELSSQAETSRSRCGCTPCISDSYARLHALAIIKKKCRSAYDCVSLRHCKSISLPRSVKYRRQILCDRQLELGHHYHV